MENKYLDYLEKMAASREDHIRAKSLSREAHQARTQAALTQGGSAPGRGPGYVIRNVESPTLPTLSQHVPAAALPYNQAPAQSMLQKALSLAKRNPLAAGASGVAGLAGLGGAGYYAHQHYAQ